MKCQSCGEQKSTLAPQKSTLMRDVVLIMCDQCRNAKFEPRHLIVLYGRSKGVEQVREFIVKRKYVGSEITAYELTP